MPDKPDAPESGTSKQRNSRSARRLLLFGFALTVALAAAWFLRHALLLIYVSAVFAVVLNPAVDRVHRAALFGWHPGRGMALLLLVLLLGLFVGGLIAIALPSILDNAAGFTDTMLKQFQSLQRRFQSVPALRNL